MQHNEKIMTALEALRDLCLKKRYLLTTAESCTGGGIAHAVTVMPGSSTWYDCSFVTYSNEAKIRMLSVNQQTIQREGAVSQAVVREMALGALRKSPANVAISVSGIAGPAGGSPDKPVGTVWFAFASDAKGVHTQCIVFSGDREAIRDGAILYALEQSVQRWQ